MWKMLNNGVCPPEPPAGFQFVTFSAGLDTHMAIDNGGRLYTWGSSSNQYGGQTCTPIESTPNFLRHPATWRQSDGYMAMVYPYQVGTKSDWIKCEHLEYIYVAMDVNGYLYAWGEDDTYGRGGWALGSQYSGDGKPTAPFIPGGEKAITPQLINNVQWKDFASGQYHILGLKPDGTLWIWGTNLDGLTYGSSSYAEDYVSRIPIHMSWISERVKLISAHYKVNAIVTESNQIYAWGSWGNDHYPEAVPTLRPLSLPVGVNITSIKCSSSGIIVLLSNGQVYAQGYRMGFVAPPSESIDFVLCPINKFFVQIAISSTGGAAVDSEGNIWAWGNEAYLITNSTGQDIRDPAIPMITAAQNEGEGRWISVGINSWSHMAIDTEGHMWTWGNNVFGLLGIGQFQSDFADSYVPIDATYFATLDSGEVPTGTVTTSAIQIVISTPLQASEHNPCGHWHKDADKFVADTGGLTIPECCWNFAVDISGNDVVLYGLGKFYPWPTIAMRYNVSTRVWYGPYWRTDNIYTQEWLAGASINGAFDGLIMYCGDVTGTILSASISQERITVKTTYHPTGEIYERYFFNTPPQNCEGKIVVSGVGTVAILIEMSSSVQLWYSIDYGKTFALGEEWSHTGQYKHARIIRDGSTYYVGIFYANGIANGQIKTYRSTNVMDWTVCATVSVHIDAIRFNMFASAGTIYLLCFEQLFFSTDGALSFTSRSTTNPTSFGVANGTDFDALVFYMYGLEKTFDYNAVAPIWSEYPKIPTIRYEITDSTTIRGSGNNVVYMRDNVFVGRRIALPVSQNLGETWEIVPTEIYYYETAEESFHGRDDPRWKFSPRSNIIDLDPQYR